MDRFLDDPNLYQRLYILDSKGQISIAVNVAEARIHEAWHRFTRLNVTGKLISRYLNLFSNWREDNRLNLNIINQHLIANRITSNINHSNKILTDIELSIIKKEYNNFNNQLRLVGYLRSVNNKIKTILPTSNLIKYGSNFNL